MENVELYKKKKDIDYDDDVNSNKIKPWLLLSFYVLGLASLLPWNFYMLSKDYFDYAFRDLNSTNSTSSLAESYESYLAFVTHIASLILVVWNALHGYKLSLSKRLVFSLLIQITIFIIIMIFIYINTDSWQSGFFILTMTLATVTLGFSNMFGSALLGLLAKFPATYTNAAMSSQGLAGIMPCIADIISISISKNPKLNAIIYFSIVLVALLIGLFFFYTLYRRVLSPTDGSINQFTYENTELYQQMTVKSILNTFKLTLRYQLLLIYNFIVTFVVFPGVVASVRSVKYGEALFYNKYYVSVFCFLVFNVGDFIGRTLCDFVKYPKENSKVFIGLCFLRTIFIPLFLMCNIHPHASYMPNIFGDYAFLGFMLVFSISNGYFITKIMMYAPRIVDSTLSELTGQLLQVSLIFGILSGSLISLLLVKL